MPAAADFCPFSCPLEPGVTLVEASAGTGKTTALARLVTRLVVDPEARVLDDGAGLPDPRRAVVVTFTEDATAELTTRIRRLLRATLAAFEGLDAAGGDPDADPFAARWGRTPAERAGALRRLRHAVGAGDAAVSTIHSFCRRVLERAAFESGEPFRFTFAQSGAEWTERALADLWHARTRAHPALAAAALAGGEPWALPTLTSHLAFAAHTPRARLAPDVEGLEAALERLAEAADALGVWDAARAEALLADAPWNKDKAPPRGAFRDVDAFARSGGTRGVDAVKALADVGGRMHKSKGRALADALAEDPAFAACRAASDALHRVHAALVAHVLREVPASARAARERAGVLTFDDLIARVHDALHDPAVGPALGEAIRAQAALALVDEFQDTDPLQEALFRTAFEGRPLVLVGDPKQAIYGFRGADLFAYLAAGQRAARRATLGRNFRSAPALVAAVNAVFARGGARAFLHDGIPFAPSSAGVPEPPPDALAGPPLVWWDLGGLERSPSREGAGLVTKGAAFPAVFAAVASEARRLVESGAARPSEIAVLVRKHEQAREVQAALRRAGLTSVATKGGNVLESDEMAGLEHVLRAVHAPADVGAIKTALAGALWGATGDDLDALGEAELGRLAEGLRADRETWRRHGVFRAVTQFCDREAVEARLLAHADGERRMTNLRHALELVHDAETAGGLAPDQLLRWVRTRADAAFDEPGTTELRLESDADAVQVTTLHACKGLQYRVLFAPVLWDEVDPGRRRGPSDPPRCRLALPGGGFETVIDLGSGDAEHHARLATAERLAEHIRLTYVALTRAERRAYVAWGPVNEAHRSGLAYLFAGAAAAGDDPCDGLRTARAQAAARARMARATGDLRAWIERDGLGALMAVEPLPGALPGGTPLELSGDGQAGRPPARVLSADAAGRIAQPARRTSFSGWTAGARHADTAMPGSTAEAVVAESVADAAEPEADAPPSGLAAFARGPAAGLALHEVLETVAWHEPDAYETPDSPASAAVARVLRRHGLAHAEAHARSADGRPALADPPAAVRALVARLARTPLPGVDVRLADLPGDARRRDTEWRFVLPLRRVAPRALAAVFDAHGDARLRAYAERLARLSSTASDGLLVGTADFVAQVGEGDERRWTLFDWKSNRLGSSPAAYTPAALEAAMHVHQYTLQAYVYALGLHRHLRARLGAAYDAERHLGGAAYVFLRAFDGDPADAPAGLGVWTERPPVALLEALDALVVDA